MSNKEKGVVTIENTPPPIITTDAYCVRCRTKNTIAKPQLKVTRNGRYAISGECEKCGKGVYRIIPTDEGKKISEKGEKGGAK